MNAALTVLMLAASAGEPAFPAAIQKNALAATVRVFHPVTRGDGSGVVVRYEHGFAYILTAAHIVPSRPQGGDDVEISFYPEGKPTLSIVPVKAEVKERMLNEDLALIKVGMRTAPPGVAPLCPRKDWPKTPIDEFAPLRVLTVGISAGDPPEAAVDWVRRERVITKPDGSRALHWEVDHPQHQGHSGGPLIDGSGRVIGICCGNMGQKGYYLSIKEIHSRLQKAAFGFLNEPASSSEPPAPIEKSDPKRKKS